MTSSDITAPINFTLLEVDVDIEGVKDDYYGEGPVTEETKPGGFIPLNGLVKINLMSLAPSELPINAAHPVTLKAISGGEKIRIWDNENKTGSPLTLPKQYTSRWSNSIPLWVEGIELSSIPRDITLALEYDGFEDRIRMTVMKLDFVRLWDAHKVADRTTRAIKKELRNSQAYEDNPRSDADIVDDIPMLVLGGFCNEMSGADLKLECGFSPSGFGEYVLWRIAGSYSSWVDGPTTGNFDISNPVDIHLNLPSAGDWTEHLGKDIAIKVGVDKNGDSTLQESEEFPEIEWGVRVINKPEYDYCRGKREFILTNLLWIVWPDACEFLDIFLDTNTFTDYSTSSPSTIYFSDDSYKQKEGLGCDETSLNTGSLTLYSWDPRTGLWGRILEDAEFWNEVIKECLIEMDILNWYNQHPAETSHTFQVSRSCDILFTEDDNLANSLHGCHVFVLCSANTIRGGLFPKITKLSIEGDVTDLYNWSTEGSDGPAGWCSRIQTSYSFSCGRTSGKIFKVDVLIDASADLGEPQQYDDYENIRADWLTALGIWL